MIVFASFGFLDKMNNELAWLNTLRIHLFVNDYTPTVDTNIGDVTEATFDGYASQLLNAWGVPEVVSPGLVRSTETLKFFTWTGAGSPQDIYGYFVTNDDGDYMYGERYAAPPFVLGTSQPTFVVLPRMDLTNI